MMEAKLKHLEFIQGVISRMASNSFQLKGWSVVIVSALFVFAAENTNGVIAFIGLLPALSFWILDGFFLWQEKLYRKLYDHVRIQTEEQIDFDMNAYRFREGTMSWCETIRSKTLLLFHVPVLLAVVVGGIVLLVVQLQGGGNA